MKFLLRCLPATLCCLIVIGAVRAGAAEQEAVGVVSETGVGRFKLKEGKNGEIEPVLQP